MKKLNFRLNIAIIKTIQEYRAAFRRLEKEARERQDNETRVHN